MAWTKVHTQAHARAHTHTHTHTHAHENTQTRARARALAGGAYAHAHTGTHEEGDRETVPKHRFPLQFKQEGHTFTETPEGMQPGCAEDNCISSATRLLPQLLESAPWLKKAMSRAKRYLLGYWRIALVGGARKF